MQLLQPLLALIQRQRPQVLVTDEKYVEHGEARLGAPVEQILELGLAVAIKAYDLAIEHHASSADILGQARSQVSEAAEAVAVARDQAAGAVVDVAQAAEAVVLQLEVPVAVVEGRTKPLEGLWLNDGIGPGHWGQYSGKRQAWCREEVGFVGPKQE